MEITVNLKNTKTNEQLGTFVLPNDEDEVLAFYDEADSDDIEVIECEEYPEVLNGSTEVETIVSIASNYDNEWKLVYENDREGINIPYPISQFDDALSGYEPERIVNMVFYGDYQTSGAYFFFNGSGNIESADDSQAEKLIRMHTRDILRTMI